MFYDELSYALNGNRSDGWLLVSRELKMTPHQLQTHIEQESLSFEQCMSAVMAAKSPELLKYVLRQLEPNFMADMHRMMLERSVQAQPCYPPPTSSRMN